MFNQLSIFALCVILAVEARIIMVQDAPITPEGISLKITVKEDRDASGHPIASVRLYIDDEKLAPKPAEDDERTNTIVPIPTFEDRFGIGNGKCPVGSVWRGVKCWPVSG